MKGTPILKGLKIEDLKMFFCKEMKSIKFFVYRHCLRILFKDYRNIWKFVFQNKVNTFCYKKWCLKVYYATLKLDKIHFFLKHSINK